MSGQLQSADLDTNFNFQKMVKRDSISRLLTNLIPDEKW